VCFVFEPTRYMDIDTLAGGVDGVAHCCKDGTAL
jgi:hypothetical protein